jgi:2-polyprenyl-3-methyl-5-hydroxy-6-metoxy-1,4-benzoquinol methylase
MTIVRDDPIHPDPGFAELYARLPDATDLEPWLTLARRARPPVLYLGAGAGRLAVPLHSKGIQLVLVDAHPAMVAHLRRRLPDVEVHQSLIEGLDLRQTFDLIIVPSNILCRADLLEAASAHLSPTGRLAFELTNPHWLAAGTSPDFKVLRQDQDLAEIVVEYPDGTIQQGEVQLVWPEEIENFLATAGLDLFRLSGPADAELDESPTFYVVAGHHLPRHIRPSRLPRVDVHGP